MLSLEFRISLVLFPRPCSLPSLHPDLAVLLLSWGLSLVSPCSALHGHPTPSAGMGVWQSPVPGPQGRLQGCLPQKAVPMPRPEHPWGLPVKIRAKDPDGNRRFIHGGYCCPRWVRSLGLEPAHRLSTYEALLIKFSEIIIDSHEVVE